MGLIVFTGGARSGKSHVAQRLAESSPDAVSVAVFAQPGSDSEMVARIARHKESRDAAWDLVEARDSVEWTQRVGDGVLLIDCLGTLVGLLMGEVLAEMGDTELAGVTEVPSGFEEEIERRLAGILGWIVKREGRTIVVTNEVGDGVVPPYATGRVFRDVLGRANRALVDRSDRTYLVVAGRLVDLTAQPKAATWPLAGPGAS